MSRLTYAWERLRDAYWLIPLACVVAAFVVSVVLVQVDQDFERTRGGLTFAGGPSSAREVLSTIAGSTLALAGLVFSITIVALQLTSSQFSPRVLRNFLRDRSNQWTLGIFLGTFTYSLAALREVRGEDALGAEFVPGITISVALVLVALSLGAFVYFIHHLAQSIRVVNIITDIADETQHTIDRLHPASGRTTTPSPQGETSPVTQVVTAPRSGVVVGVDVKGLGELSERLGCDLTVIPAMGAFVPQGAPLIGLGSPANTGPESELPNMADLQRRVFLDREREVRDDVAFGFRQLVDIAEKGLSPGINDPTTAVQCLDQLHRLLRVVGTRPWPPTTTLGPGGFRVTVRRPTWEELTALALDEIRHWGADSIQVHARMHELLTDLLRTVPEERQAPLRHQLHSLSDRRRTDLPAVEQNAVDDQLTSRATTTSPFAASDQQARGARPRNPE